MNRGVRIAIATAVGLAPTAAVILMIAAPWLVVIGVTCISFAAFSGLLAFETYRTLEEEDD